jgi:hypothetical protein
MASDALFSWLNASSGVERRAREAEDLYDGEVMHRALARSSPAAREEEDEEDFDYIQKLSRQLRDSGARDDVSALRARDARGTMRVLREVYAESLRRRVAAFTLERERREETPGSRRDVDKDVEEEGRDLIETYDAVEEEEEGFDGEDDGWEEEDEGDWVEDVDETDETEDWRALASPASARRENAGGEREESPMRFLRASDMLRELDLNDVDASESLRSPSEGSSRGTSVKKTLTRTPPPVPKTLRLWRSQSPKQRQKPAGWDVVFDEAKTMGRAPKWFPGMRRAESMSPSRSRSPPTKPFSVSWMGDDDDDDDDEFNLQRAAQRRGQLISMMPSSPERRRSDAGVASCYRPPTSPSNKRVIRNALRVLVGPPDREPYVDAVRAIDACEFPSVVILLKGSADVAPYKLRGVYAVVENTTLKKIHGAGPPYLRSDEVVAALKYDTASMSFTTLPSPAITPTVAAISLTRAR